MIGVEFSLSCLQQKAFQAIKLLNLLTSYKTQIDNTLAWLFQAEWDFVTVDFPWANICRTWANRCRNCETI